MRQQVSTVKQSLKSVGFSLVLAGLFFATSTAQDSTGNYIPANARITKNEVIAVQVELRRLGYLKTRLSAELDPETREAVKAYQADNKLQVTGKIDTPTYSKLGLPYPATKPGDKTIATQVGGTVKEGTRVGLEKTWDAGSMAASKSKDAAKVSLKGAKVAGGAAKRKADSMIRRNDEDTAPEVEEVFASKPEWRKLEFAVKDGMVTIKLPTKSNVDVGALVSEVRKVAGVRSVFVIAL